MPCHSGIASASTATGDYHHHQGYTGHHFGGDLASYYPQSASELVLNGGSQHSLPSSTPPGNHYSPPGTFHGAAGSLHPFNEPGTGIISEQNGRSYTNLDSNASNFGSNSVPAPHAHFSCISQYSSSAQGTTHPSGPQCSSQLSSTTTSHGSIYSQPYREPYGSTTEPSTPSTPTTVKSEYGPSGANAGPNGSSNPHHEMMSPISECSLGRTSSSSSGSAHYPSYLDPGLLSRGRNGATSAAHHAMHLQNGLVSPYVEPSAHYPEMTCSQLNGNYHHHHLNHLTNHLQSSHHHHSSNARNSNQSSSSSLLTPVSNPVQYKWMTVKRSTPKPSKHLVSWFSLKWQTTIARLAA